MGDRAAALSACAVAAVLIKTNYATLEGKPGSRKTSDVIDIGVDGRYAISDLIQKGVPDSPPQSGRILSWVRNPFEGGASSYCREGS